MLTFRQLGGYEIWNQLLETYENAPQPQLLEASDTTFGPVRRSGKNEMPFQAWVNVDHHAMSALPCWFRKTWWNCPLGIFIVSMSWRVKVQPGLTTGGGVVQ